MSATTDRVFTVVEPVAERLGLRVYDVDQPGGTVRVMLDADDGVDIDALAVASREISAALDSSDPVAGSSAGAPARASAVPWRPRMRTVRPSRSARGPVPRHNSIWYGRAIAATSAAS